MNITDTFKRGPKEKGSFLSRIFGIFSEEIVRIWAKDERSPYSISDRRPTLYDGDKLYVLDFLFHRDGKSYVSEMKCEIQYQNYKYWSLIDPSQLEHHRTKRAFQLFLDIAKEPSSVPVKAGDVVTPSGAILVWGSVTPQGVQLVRSQFGILDVLSVEGCIQDLLAWNNREYQDLVSDRKEWSDDLYRTLFGIEMAD